MLFFVAEKGFCILGESCPYDHGLDPLVIGRGLPTYPPTGIPGMGVPTLPPPPPGHGECVGILETYFSLILALCYNMWINNCFVTF